MNNNPNQSDNIGKLAEALAKAQGTLKAAVKATENPYFKSHFADLPTVMDACREALSANGIAVIQTTDFGPINENGWGDVWLQTILAHSSGEWIMGRYPVRPSKNDPQGYASAITYARRYALMAAVGVVAQDASEDDGNAASGTGETYIQAAPPKHAPTQAQSSKKVAEATATKAMSDTNKTAAENFYWECIKALGNFDSLADFDKWHNPLLGRIAKLKAYNESNHQKLMKAIEETQVKLGAHMTTVDDGGNSYQVRV